MKTRMAIAAALLGLAAGAQAAEIIMFDAPGLSGRQLNVRTPMQDITTYGNGYDRTASILVSSGTWEVCTDANFHGFCATLQPGEYRVLDPRFNGRIMSVREVGPVFAQAPAYPSNPPPQLESRPYDGPAYAPRGALELYARPGFAGRSLTIDRDAPNLDALGFNDRASSLVVLEGRWELCSDAGFRGTCQVFEPGRYADVGNVLDRQISSARMLLPRGERRPPVAYDPRPAPMPRIVLFDNENFGGRSLSVVNPLEDLRRSNFNNDAASVVVESGSWEVCSDSYYRGRCQVLLPGQYRRLDPEMYRSISSVRPADVAVEPGGRPGIAAVELFEGINFDGRRRLISEPTVPNLDARNFTDRASSMIIHEGQWEVCADAGYNGRCRVFGPGRYADLGRMNNEISSLRRIN